MFALVDFQNEDGAMDIVSTRHIIDFKLEEAKRYDEVSVRWTNPLKPSKQKTVCAAILLQIAENRADLVDSLEKIVKANNIDIIQNFPFMLTASATMLAKREIKLPKWRAQDNNAKMTNQKADKIQKQHVAGIQKKADDCRSLQILDIQKPFRGSSNNSCDSDSDEIPCAEDDVECKHLSKKMRKELSIESERSSIDGDILRRKESNDALKAELAYEKKKRIETEKELASLKESVNIVKQLRAALSEAKQLSHNQLQLNGKDSSKTLLEKQYLRSSSPSPGCSYKTGKITPDKTNREIRRISFAEHQNQSSHHEKSIDKSKRMPLQCKENISDPNLLSSDGGPEKNIGKISLEKENNILLEGTDIHLPANVHKELSQKNYSRYASDLLLAVFGRNMLQTHVLKKQANSPKPALNQDQLKQLTEHVKIKFAVDASFVRSAFRNKMSNVKDKKMKTEVDA